MQSIVRRFVVLIALLTFLPLRVSAQPAPDVAPTDPSPASQDAAAEAPPPAPEAGEATVTYGSGDVAVEEPPAEVAIEPVSVSSTLADVLQNVAIHGFGNYGAGWTHVRENNTNEYQYGDHNGNFGNVNFSLRELVQPIPELRFFAGQSFSVDDGDVNVELDLAGAQWTPNRWFSLRAGRILSPFGIYTEVYRVGTLRPFGALPSSIYAQAGFIAQSYDGAEFALTVETERGWRARFSLLGGRAVMPQDGGITRVLEAKIGQSLYTQTSDVVMDLMMGGHIAVETPIEGFGFAAGLLGSPARYTSFLGDEDVPQSWNNIVMLGSAYYLRDKLELRAEIAYRFNHARNGTGPNPDMMPMPGMPMIQIPRTIQKTYGFYIEAAYRIIDSVQVGLRFERMNQNYVGSDQIFTRLDDMGNVIGGYGSMEHSTDIGAVISYWWTRDFVMKLEYHFIDGNRLAHPSDVGLYDLITNNRLLAQQTHYVGFSSAFSF